VTDNLFTFFTTQKKNEKKRKKHVVTRFSPRPLTGKRVTHKNTPQVFNMRTGKKTKSFSQAAFCVHSFMLKIFHRRTLERNGTKKKVPRRARTLIIHNANVISNNKNQAKKNPIWFSFLRVVGRKKEALDG
jgi:hypothetical protein